MATISKTKVSAVGRESVTMRTSVPSFFVKLFGLEHGGNLVWDYDAKSNIITLTSEISVPVELKAIEPKELEFDEPRTMQKLSELLEITGLMETGPNRFGSDGKFRLTLNDISPGFIVDQIRLTKEYLIVYDHNEPLLQFRIGGIMSIKVEAVNE